MDDPGTHRVLIKKCPISVEMSLKELEKNYASKPEWKEIEDGGVLSIPMEEFGMINPPKANFAQAKLYLIRRKEGEQEIKLKTILLVKPS